MISRVIKLTFAVVVLAVCFCGKNKGDGGGLRKNDSDTNKLAARTQVLDSVDSLPSPIEPKDGISANEKDEISINEYAPFSFAGYDEPDEDVSINSIDSERSIDHVGYDGKTPIFRSRILCAKRCQPDSVIYEYVDRRLKKMDMVAPSGTELVIVKNGVYVFREDIDSQTTRYHLKVREKETIISSDIRFKGIGQWGEVMNDKYIFIKDGGPTVKGSRILRVNYRTQAKTDTIRLTEYCSELLDADNNYLYFVDYTPHEAGRDGSLYRMDLKTKISEVIVWNTENVTECMALVAPLNLLYTHGEIADYKNDLFAISPDKTLRYSAVGAFYSYEDKAFILSGWETDINKWRILRLQDIIEWMPGSDAYEKKTGPWAVPFIKRCENNRCTTGVARAYREQTGCTDLSGLSGNQMFDYLVKSSKGPQPAFKKIGIDETYTLANGGRIVIAAHKNTKEHGHVALIVPGKSKNEEYWQGDAKIPVCYSCEKIYLPYVKDTGPKKPVEKQLISESYEPRRQRDVKFFVYMGTGCKEQGAK